MKIQNVALDNNLYRFHVDLTGTILACEVSVGNRCVPWRQISLEDVPAEALNRVLHRIAKDETFGIQNSQRRHNDPTEPCAGN